MSGVLQAVRRTADLLGRDNRIVRGMRPLYQQALELAYRGRGMPWSINGVRCRIEPGQRGEMGQRYDAGVAAWLRERVRPGDVAWNVGANVGVYVLQLADMVGPRGHVVAVEPNPAARAILQRHLAYNGLAGRVTVVASAVGAASGQATLYAAGSDGMSALAAPNPVVAASVVPVTVPVTTLDALAAAGLPEPHWIVMDIEGFELAALSGGRELLARRGDALGIVVELHPDLWPHAGTSQQVLDALLAETNRTVQRVRSEEDPGVSHPIVALEPRAA